MARRILDTSFWDDTDVAALTYPERLLLICMITDEALSNDYGWLPAHPALLKKHAFGYDTCTVSEVEAWRDGMLEKCKNVKLYSVNGQDYICLVGFPKWQKIRYRRNTNLPPPPWWTDKAADTVIPEDSCNSAETSSKDTEISSEDAQDSCSVGLGSDGLGSVGKGSDGKDTASAKRPRASSGKNAIRKALEEHFISKTKLPLPPGATAKQRKAAGEMWWVPLMRIAELTEWDLARGTGLIDAALARLEGLTVSAPKSIMKTAEAIVGEWARDGSRARDGPSAVLPGPVAYYDPFQEKTIRVGGASAESTE